jgi:Rod binding domain-containing protein
MTTHSIHFPKRFSHAKPVLPGAKHHAELVKQAQKWVSQTFFGSMLKEMRNSPFKSEMFSGGRGGEAFSEMFDQQLADHMGKGSGKKLVDALVHKMEGGQAPKAAKTAMAHRTAPISEAIKAYSRSHVKAGVKK